MKSLYVPELEKYRVRGEQIIKLFGSEGDHEHGCFSVPSPIDSKPLWILAARGLDWEHLSISRQKRCPNWPEMDYIKRLFFPDNEVVMQLHVESTDHIDLHPYCLHLWRPLSDAIPLPPQILV